MRARRLVLAGLLVLAGAGCGPAPPSHDSLLGPAQAPLRSGVPDAELRRDSKVVLITLDGVRWQDFFDTNGSFESPARRPLFAHFWARLAPRGAAFGDRSRHSRARIVAERPASLPSYQAILAGFATDCRDNHCGPIEVETVLEYVRRSLGLERREVAVFASWERIRDALARQPETIHVDVRPGGGADAETFREALAYLRQERPRLLYVALAESDKLAHAGDREGYLASLRRYDGYLAELSDTLDELGPAYRDHTTVLLTTDHGRGPWWFWREHWHFGSARDVFVAGWGPFSARIGRAGRTAPVSHGDLRPTIERLFGLSPAPCPHPGCGAPIPEIVAGLAATPGRPAQPIDARGDGRP